MNHQGWLSDKAQLILNEIEELFVLCGLIITNPEMEQSLLRIHKVITKLILLPRPAFDRGVLRKRRLQALTLFSSH